MPLPLINPTHQRQQPTTTLKTAIVVVMVTMLKWYDRQISKKNLTFRQQKLSWHVCCDFASWFCICCYVCFIWDLLYHYYYFYYVIIMIFLLLSSCFRCCCVVVVLLLLSLQITLVATTFNVVGCTWHSTTCAGRCSLSFQRTRAYLYHWTK